MTESEQKRLRFLAYAGVGVLALLLRVISIIQIEHAPLGHILLGDAAGYDQWARKLADGDWIGKGVFYQAPLYPYLLGVLYLLAGPGLLTVRIAQAVLGSVSCVLLAGAGALWFNRRTGLVAGVLLALYPPAIFFDGLVQKASLDLMLTCALLLVMGWARPQRPWHWLPAGAGTALLALNRENALLLAPGLMLWLAFRTRALGWRHLLLCETAFLFGFALVLAPVVARNAMVGGEFHLTTAQFGPNFYIGNNPQADGQYQALRYARGSPETERTDATELAEQAVGRKLTPAEVSAYWRDRAVQFIRGQPRAWLALMGRKTLLLLNWVELADTEDLYTWAEQSRLFGALTVCWHFGFAAPLAMAGVALTWRHRRRLWPLHLIVFVYALSVVVFYVFARYRFPLVPVVMLFAAAALTAPWLGLVRERRYGRAGTALLLAAGTAFVTNREIVSVDVMRATTHLNFGWNFMMRGENAPAKEQLWEAMKCEPSYVCRTQATIYYNFGLALDQQGHPAMALKFLQTSLRFNPKALETQALFKNVRERLRKPAPPASR